MAGEEPIGITIIAADFATGTIARRALDDLGRWLQRGDRDASAYRLAGDDGAATIVVAVVLTDSGHAQPIVRRFKRGGGTIRDLPEADKCALVERTIEAGVQGLSGRRYNIAIPLAGRDTADQN